MSEYFQNQLEFFGMAPSFAFVRQPADLRRTFASVAGYLPPGAGFEAMHNTPQSSQRARQIEVWSVLRTLGRQGVADLVTGACDAATTIAARLLRPLPRDSALAPLLARMGLAAPRGLRERLMRRVVVGALTT